MWHGLHPLPHEGEGAFGAAFLSRERTVNDTHWKPPMPTLTCDPLRTEAPSPAAAIADLVLPAVARYRLDFVVSRRLVLPAFAGSTLRGVFGHSLRRQNCATGQTDCEGCPLLARCAYARIFEPRPPAWADGGAPVLQDFSHIPRPYLIEPPSGGERTWNEGEMLAFHLVLAGNALRELPQIVRAFAQALTRDLGPARGGAVLRRVSHVLPDGEQVLLDTCTTGHGCALPAHDTRAPALAATHAGARAVTLHFDTPLRLQNNGRRATLAEHTPARLLNALVRRIALVAQYHGAGPLPLDFSALAAHAAALHSQPRLRWQDWRRHSSRQQRSMYLGGYLGSWHLAGDALAPFLPFLHLGQWLHVGKETVFGFGGYRLEWHI